MCNLELFLSYLSSYTQLNCLYIGTTLKNFRLFVKKIKKMYFMSVNGKDGRQVQLYESDILSDREAIILLTFLLVKCGWLAGRLGSTLLICLVFAMLLLGCYRHQHNQVEYGWLAGRHQSLPLTYLVPIVHCLGIG